MTVTARHRSPSTDEDDELANTLTALSSDDGDGDDEPATVRIGGVMVMTRTRP